MHNEVGVVFFIIRREEQCISLVCYLAEEGTLCAVVNHVHAPGNGIVDVDALEGYNVGGKEFWRHAAVDYAVESVVL